MIEVRCDGRLIGHTDHDFKNILFLQDEETKTIISNLFKKQTVMISSRASGIVKEDGTILRNKPIADIIGY